MQRVVITGSFSPNAIKGFMDKPSNRWTVIDGLISAAGGKLENYYITTGHTDFVIIATADDVKSLLAAVMAAAGSGALSNIQTQLAFTTSEFEEMHRAAASVRASFTPPGS